MPRLTPRVLLMWLDHLSFNINSRATTITGGRYESPIELDGTISTRPGQNVICPGLLLGGIVTDDETQGS